MSYTNTPRNSTSLTNTSESVAPSYANDGRNSTAITNQNKTALDLTWDGANFTWDNANGTWDGQLSNYVRQTRNTTSFTPVNKS